MQTLSRPSCQALTELEAELEARDCRPRPGRRPSSSRRPRGSGRGRRPSAPPARSRTSRGPSSGRRSRGSPAKTARKPRSCARSSSSEPGSVIAANCAPRPPVRSQKYSRWERVSIVEPDFEEARKSVCSRSTVRSSRRIASGCVVSRTWNDSTLNVRRSTSGRERRAAHAEQDAVVELLGRGLREGVQLVDVDADARDDVEPAEPVILARVGPERSVVGPDPLDDRRHAAASSARLARIPSSSSWNESANFCTPSASSVSTTSS